MGSGVLVFFAILADACLLICIGVAAFVIVRALGRRRERVAHFAPGYPLRVVSLQNDGPGDYLIIGVDSATSNDVKTCIEAETLANAKVKAELRGIIVTDIVKQ